MTLDGEQLREWPRENSAGKYCASRSCRADEIAAACSRRCGVRFARIEHKGENEGSEKEGARRERKAEDARLRMRGGAARPRE